MVKMIEVKSTNIDRIGYDAAHGELFVKFRNDGSRVYKYMRVPKMVWKYMLRADSKGSFLKQILLPYFEVEQIKDDDVLDIPL
jgi:hypothetical protein